MNALQIGSASPEFALGTQAFLIDFVLASLLGFAGLLVMAILFCASCGVVGELSGREGRE